MSQIDGIILSVDGEDLGPFTLEEVRALIEEGSVGADTWCWCEGMEGWAPLAELVPASAHPEVPPALTPASPVPVLPRAPVRLATGAPSAAAPSPYPGATASRFRQEVLKQRAGGRALVAGWFLALVAVVLSLLAAVFYFYIFQWLAVAATLVFAMVAMIRGRIGGGILLFLTVLLVPLTASWFVRARGLVIGPIARLVEPEYKGETIQFLDAQFERTEEVMRLSGRVRNISRFDVQGVDVVVEWKDAEGQVLSRDTATVAGGRILRPGEEVPFEIVAKDDPRMKKYTTVARIGAGR